MTTRGRFVALEGGEATGKSTQARLLAAAIGAVLTREPGGTVLGERLRDLVLDPSLTATAPRAELLIMVAARAQHVVEVVEPALAAGRNVVTDRFTGSSVAYQGHGRGLPIEEVAQLSQWASDGVEPDLNILLDLPVQVAAARLAGARDRLEAAGVAFHEAVRAGFHALAGADPQRWVVLDGMRPVDEVAAAVRAAVGERLDL